jgi:signal transduction histidine kinase
MPVPAPTARQLAGLGVTLMAVAAFSLYTQHQLDGLRKLQTDAVERNRRDSLELVRIQNNLSQIGLMLRDMAEGGGPYGAEAYRASLERLRADLDDALVTEARLAPATRTRDQQQLLRSTLERFWGEMNRYFALATSGSNEANVLIRTRLEAERGTVGTLVSKLLIDNGEVEAASATQIADIYAHVERNLYVLLAAVLLAIVVTSLSVIRFNRGLFGRLTRLSEDRKALAAQLIDVQEELFRSLARELHDEFGQVLTAVGAMLSRVEKRVSAQPEIQTDVREVRQVANGMLERVRSMSQMLHPTVLDDYGLEKSIDWYTDKYGNQTGLKVHYEKIGLGPWIGDQIAIHVYRILQEALNNVARHAGVEEVWVKVRYAPHELELSVEDHGKGFPPEAPARGFGVVAMRERAELLGGALAFQRPEGGGTRVTLKVPLLGPPLEAA